MDTVRVEAFNAQLRGKKIWIVGDEAMIPNRLHVVEQELLGRGRKVLVLTDNRKLSAKWMQRIEWDGVFRIRDSNDLRLLLTYVMNIVKPIRLVWLGDEAPSIILQKMSMIDCTMIGHGLQQPRGDWDVIFYPSAIESNRVEESLLTRMGSAKLATLNLRSVMPELRAARAGLVWSNIGESERAGGIYWYDIAEGDAPQEPVSGLELATSLRELADRIACAK
jgi:hypothetical protein